MAQNNPYVGPRTFTKEERNRFFGREQEARDLISLIISERLVLFYAQSGAGKSSLVNTRIIPQLVEQEGFIALPVGRVSGELPEGVTQVDNIFAFNLMLALDHSQQDPNRFAHLNLTTFLKHLTTTDGEHYYYDDTAVSDEEAENYEIPPHILIIDQFEEIVNTHLSRWQERDAFFQQLNQAMQDDPLLWVLLTLREDYIAALRPYNRLMFNNMRARFYMKRMEAEAAQQAIEAPADLGKRPFAPGVAQILVDNLRQIRVQGETHTQSGQYVEPVQLQVVCYQLWQNLEGSSAPQITAEHLQELGDVDRALGQFYEHALANVLRQTHTSEVTLRNWFDTKLITEANTRGTVYQGPTETAGLDNQIVNLLANQFLLRAEIRAGGTWYELVHDRFVDPILGANQQWRLKQSPLIQAAETWERSGRNRDKLYKGEQLKEVLGVIDRNSQEPIVQAFLTASEEAQSQRDLTETRTLMEEERRRAAIEARTAQRLRRLSVGLALMIVLALVATFLAVRNASVAEQNAMEAVNNANLAATSEAHALANAYLAATSEAQAVANAQLAATSESQAVANAYLAATSEAQAIANAELAATREAEAIANAELAAASEAEAERLSRISLAQSLAAQSPRVVDRTNDTELATLLAVQALHINREVGNTTEDLFDNALRDALGHPYFNTTLLGHEGFIQTLAFAPDGQILASADEEEVILWNLNSDSSDFVRLPVGGVLYMAFNPDGTILATMGRDVISLWDTAKRPLMDTPVLVTELDIKFGGNGRIAFAPNNQQMTAYNDSGEVWRWDLTSTSPVSATLLTPERQTGQVLILSPNGKYLISAAKATIYIRDLDVPGATIIQSFTSGLGYDITHASFRPDSQAIVTADIEGNITVWDFTNPRVVPTPMRFTPQVSSIGTLAFSSNGSTLASISFELSDLNVHLWNLQTPRVPAVLLAGHNSGLRDLAFSPDGLFLASAGEDKTVRLWSLAPPVTAPFVLETDSSLSQVEMSANGQVVTALSDDNKLYFGNIADEGSSLQIVEIPQEEQDSGDTTTAFNAAAGLLASTNVLGTDIYVWQAQSEQPTPSLLHTLIGHQAYIVAMAISTDGHYLASASDDGVVFLWDLTASPPVAVSLGGNDFPVYLLAFSPHTQWLAASDNETIYLWNLGDPLVVTNHLLNLDAPLAVTKIIPSGQDGSIQSLAFSQDEQKLAIGSTDRTARVWDITAVSPAETVTILSGHEDWVLDVAFSADGITLASGSWDRTIRLWNLTAENPSAAPVILVGHLEQVVSVAFTLDGETLISSSNDRTVRFWPIQLNTFENVACQKVRRNLSWAEWQRYIGDEPYHLTCPNWPVHPSLVEAGRQIAATGDINGAIAWFQHLTSIDPELGIDPETEAKRFAAQALVEQARALAEDGDVEAAVALFQEALALDPALEIDPEVEVASIATNALLAQGWQLVLRGDVLEAIEVYQEAAAMAPGDEVTDQDWGTLCWYGTLWGYPAEVLFACENGIFLNPTDGNIRDSRGVARALLGDYEGAIEDFQFFIEWAADEPDSEADVALRQEWIAALQAGQNPFDEETLEMLRLGF